MDHVASESSLHQGSYQQWVAEVSATCSSLMIQLEQRTVAPESGELSLVTFVPKGSDADATQRVHLLHWYVVGDCGRVADLDERNAVKAIVPVGAKRFPLSFKDMSMSMLLPRTGTSMVKEKGKARPLLSPKTLRLMKLWDTSFSFQNGRTAAHVFPTDSCDFCQPSQTSGNIGVDVSSKGECVICPCCLLTGHLSCFESVNQSLVRARMSMKMRRAGPSISSQTDNIRRRVSWPLPDRLPDASEWDTVFRSSARQAENLTSSIVYKCFFANTI